MGCKAHLMHGLLRKIARAPVRKGASASWKRTCTSGYSFMRDTRAPTWSKWPCVTAQQQTNG